jgi:integrase
VGRARFRTLALTGMRLGELRALRWQDVDTAKRMLHVARSASRGRIQATKTGDPRDAGIGADLAARIDAHRLAVAAADMPVFGPALVFPSWQTHGTVSTNMIHDVLTNLSRRSRHRAGRRPSGASSDLRDAHGAAGRPAVAPRSGRTHDRGYDRALHAIDHGHATSRRRYRRGAGHERPSGLR